MSGRSEERRFSHLFNLIGDAVVEIELVETTPIVRTVNPAFVEVFGYEREALLGESLNAFIVPDDRVEEASQFDERTKIGEYNSAEVTRETAEGPRDFLYRGVPYEREGREFGFAIYTDITERNERKRELEAYKRELEASNEKLERFAYVASHDLQEPLRMVSSYVDLLAVELGDDLDEETAEYMEFAVDGAERMREMIDALLTYSRVQTAADPFERVETETVIAEIRQDLALVVEDAEVIVGDLPAVTADRSQLGQLFQNLIKNAIEHGPPGVTVEITADREPEVTTFRVVDDGPGIPERQRERLFEIFEKGSDSDGTGIGLAVCGEIVERHGGEIDVETVVGEGTTFVIRLPDTPG